MGIATAIGALIRVEAVQNTTSALPGTLRRGVGSTTEWAVVMPFMSACLAVLHRVEGLDVDVRETEHRNEENDRERRRVAGSPLLERLALQRDRGDLGRRARPARGEQIHHV